MNFNGLTGGVYQITTWIVKLVYLNILWILFTFLGLLIVGIMPSTAALFAVIRKLIMGEVDIPILPTFWKYYKQEFLRINLLGFVLCLLGGILYLDIYYFSKIHDGISRIALYFFFVLAFFYAILVLNIFPLYVHYQLKMFQYIKFAFLLGMSNVIGNVITLVSMIGIYFILLHFPTTFLFFSVSGLGFIIMWVSYRRFTKIDDQGRSELIIKNMNT
ncbi:YesL family protein [Pullulanibacillus sp. KACC 23026]|uniref:YesL family protein n=1 Tax=Pullulanibacillus sp. KACC 23026 TaxID=3028315 RepID=UPI0023AF3D3F|nr:YesL family protein [Pullulanibacillus sp. KACC 23026]WEG13498.1 YesL family protein [Pullulanibacillus sp. KACC 23026]